MKMSFAKMEKAKYLRIKNPVKVKYKKKVNGTRTVYFIIYINGERYYEYLSMYLVPENSDEDKDRNAETMKEVYAIRSQLLEDITKQRFRPSKSRLSIKDFMKVYIKNKVEKKSKSRKQVFSCLLKHLVSYIKQERLSFLKIGDINLEFCQGFYNYLETAQDKRKKKPTAWALKKGITPKLISEVTVSSYFEGFDLALSWAVKHCYLVNNPIGDMHFRMKRSSENQSFLTVEDLKTLAKTSIPDPETKRAFFFCCMSNLRIFDIMSFTWSDISIVDSVYFAHIVNKKTGKHSTQPISRAAMVWLPERGESQSTDKVFSVCRKSAIENHINEWVKNSRLEKPVSFHVARRTYSQLIAMGIDLYAVSLDLGVTAVDLPDIHNISLRLNALRVTSLFSDIFK